VLVTHGLATAIKDKRLATVAEHELDSTILSDQFDYIALGHYHRQCQITDNAWYSGSTEYLTYGEIADTKGGLLVDPGRHEVTHLDLPNTPMVDLGTIKCEGVHPGDITEEIISRIVERSIPRYSMAQVTLDGLSREHGKGIDMKSLAVVREQLLDLKIRVQGKDAESPVPLQQDVRAIDYIREFSAFAAKQQQLNARQKEYIGKCGLEVLQTVMEQHREVTE
jgi:DNA repair exonuclease SbcCD nuclease subunit